MVASRTGELGEEAKKITEDIADCEDEARKVEAIKQKKAANAGVFEKFSHLCNDLDLC